MATSVAENAGALDVEALYGALARRLEQIVRVDVRASDAVIEDACSFAWIRLLHHRHRVHRETVVPWLARTAIREAFKLLGSDRGALSLEAELEQLDESPEDWLAAGAPEPHDVVEQRERLAELGRLPQRQQRVMWLQGFGLSYAEIADREGCTLRTVERQLLRAKDRVREPGF
jgi:RNA polymerase sigma factor (sigma-70 family)